MAETHHRQTPWQWLTERKFSLLEVVIYVTLGFLIAKACKFAWLM